MKNDFDKTMTTIINCLEHCHKQREALEIVL